MPMDITEEIYLYHHAEWTLRHAPMNASQREMARDVAYARLDAALSHGGCHRLTTLISGHVGCLGHHKGLASRVEVWKGFFHGLYIETRHQVHMRARVDPSSTAIIVTHYYSDDGVPGWRRCGEDWVEQKTAMWLAWRDDQAQTLELLDSLAANPPTEATPEDRAWAKAKAVHLRAWARSQRPLPEY